MECEEIRKEYPDKKIEYCCESCHEDDSMGFGDDLWIMIENKLRNLCCAVMRAFKEK